MAKTTVAYTPLAVVCDIASAAFAAIHGRKKASFFASLYYWNSTTIFDVVFVVLDFMAWHQQHPY